MDDRVPRRGQRFGDHRRRASLPGERQPRGESVNRDRMARAGCERPTKRHLSDRSCSDDGDRLADSEIRGPRAHQGDLGEREPRGFRRGDGVRNGRTHEGGHDVLGGVRGSGHDTLPEREALHTVADLGDDSDDRVTRMKRVLREQRPVRVVVEQASQRDSLSSRTHQ